MQLLLDVAGLKERLKGTPPAFSVYGDDGAGRAELLARSNDLFEVVKTGKVKIETKRYKLADAQQAHRDLESRKTTGSIVLQP